MEQSICAFTGKLPSLHVKARAIFLHAGQVPVAHGHRVGEDAVQRLQEFPQALLLLRRAGVRRVAPMVEAALVADADAAAVEPASVRSHLQ